MKRFDQLLSHTGMIEMQSFYTGRKNINSPLKKAGIKGINLCVEKTNKSYVDKDFYSYDSYPSGMRVQSGEGLIIRINNDCSDVLYWGQKMKWTPNSVVLIGDKDMPSYKQCGTRTIMKICYEVETGKNANERDNAYSAAYWADFESDYRNFKLD